jgi:hypothetical protein
MCCLWSATHSSAPALPALDFLFHDYFFMFSFLFFSGLGYDYDSPLAVSPLQKWLTMSRAEVVLTDIPPATWNFITSTVVPFAGKLGYKVSSTNVSGVHVMLHHVWAAQAGVLVGNATGSDVLSAALLLDTAKRTSQGMTQLCVTPW